LLRRERERADRSRTVAADPKNPSAGFFRRPTHLLDALEAGEPVTVAAWQVSSPRVAVPDHLRPGNCPGAWWRVSPDNVVAPADSPVVDRVWAPRRSAAPKAGD
jgi:hypothetical protein